MNKHLNMTDVIQSCASASVGVRAGRSASLVASLPEIRPCPWCLEDVGQPVRRCGIWLVGCESDACGEKRITVQASGETAEEAIRNWNDRP